MSTYDQSPPDEGYSEDPLTIRTSQHIPPWMKSLSVPERTEYVMSIIAQLPTSEVAEIVRRLRPRLYINFFQHLPTEVLLQIFGFLDPLSLINTARASREWMTLALDWKLWEQLYLLEGFRVNRAEVQQFETALNADRSRLNTQDDAGHSNKRRATPQKIIPALGHADSDFDMLDIDLEMRPSIFGGPIKREPSQLQGDADVVMSSSTSPGLKTQYPSRSTSKDLAQLSSKRSSQSSHSSALSSLASLVVLDRRGTEIKKKLNWQYLYAQRRRLEANWETERYTNFQLPDPNYPEEAHDECIYTIQHSGKYLVSGSRDKTVRIWNLDTRRLVRLPLRAHTGSVLCLQFDADPEEDLIVSGSSDSTVVLWKFSTGQILQRLRKAHRESVLNVRFDKRVLITCSKDKTIKIFNRRPLHAGEPGYPIDMHISTTLNNYGFNPAPTAGLPIKPAYSLIGCLEGHGAAVNAVQIYGDEIVSASGDRCVKLWNWIDRRCIKTLIGHTKGIACVQYDGRRIVSGSSDNEVKVFDKETGLEVASLRAHTNLVRTVQAGFGDLPYSTEEDRKLAKQIDNQLFESIDSGATSHSNHPGRSRHRNAGSRRPEDICAYGAKLPPGGGGGRFGRIISGSYDETIIIWRRDKEGIWRAQHTLRQEEGASAAAHTVNETPANDGDASAEAPESSSAAPAEVNAPTTAFAPGSDAFYHHLIDLSVARGAVALRHALRQHPQMLNYERLSNQILTMPPQTRTLMNTVVINARSWLEQRRNQADIASQMTATIPANISAPQASATVSTLPIISASSAPQAPAPSTSLPSSAPASATTQPPLGMTPTIMAATTANAQLGTAALHPNHAAHHHLTTNMARVFKLQFDARRIVCCSQTNIIVGWDFANADEKIIDASRFFAPVE